jgi:NAD(P)-dependent dehydrogenase (short-subunit alcohol dehydrogenase family)
MVREGNGHIVNITTSLVDQPMTAVPSALAALTKGGLDAVTRPLAIEYAGKGIRVNAVSPGIMRSLEAHGFLATLHPVGRMGAIEEIVEAVLYHETAGFVTGETLHVDGGAHAGRW